MFSLKDKKAIITGAAGKGLGSGMARALLSAGASLVIIDISSALDESVDELSTLGKVYGVHADISTGEGRKKAFAEAISLLGGKKPTTVNVKLIGEEILEHPLISIDKQNKTPAAYPRPFAQISKKPL